ncbi:hypothetical protein FRC03_010326 [Tulasnella sp. 419]|nr:hypothetical protein FRC03_010326 [Tulasnella sp. 419]
MRVLSTLLLIPLFVKVLAQEKTGGGPATKHDYQSDVARMRKIVIESLYSHKDVFLRELVSNANDAIEKWRILALKEGLENNNPLNITIKLVPDEVKGGGKIILTDTGIGMTPEELTKNLGTLAKSGTAEFLKAANEKNGAQLIGQFGLGFYSSFLVASDVYVASLPPPTKENPDPVQHVFASSTDATSFEVYRDPRGNTLQRGTEITLVLKDDSLKYLMEYKVKDLIEKHSAFSTAHPIYLYTSRMDDVPLEEGDEGYEPPKPKKEKKEKKEEEKDESEEKKEDDEEELKEADEEEEEEEEVPVKTKKVKVENWVQLNDQPPLWTRDPKSINDTEYIDFYRATYKEPNDPLAWHHFKGDTGSGTSFRALFYLPSAIPQDFWNSPKSTSESVRLYVKRVFITNDLGEQALPKWISWMKAIIDADDLPLNVSRETLQSTKFLSQAKQVLIKRLIQLLTRIASEDQAKFKRIMKAGYSALLKLGAVESAKDRTKILSIIRFKTNLRESVTLDQYIEKKRKGQDQMFYLAGVGQEPDDLAKSVFVEKLTARGYEVLLFTEPMDEILFSQVRDWKDMKLQDVAKEGLKFGDEDEDKEAEEAALKEATEKYQPLIDYLKEEGKEMVSGVQISNRLVTSPCAIVASQQGYSSNMQRLLASQHTQDAQQKMIQEWARKQRVLEINPKSPLIQGLLAKWKQVNDVEEGEEKDPELVEELKEVSSILIDGALVRSGFDVADANLFFYRVDRVLRRSLGVSETAEADATVKPAPEEVEAVETPKQELPDLEADEDLSKVEEFEAPFDPSEQIRMATQNFMKEPETVAPEGGAPDLPVINLEDDVASAEAEKPAHDEL